MSENQTAEKTKEEWLEQGIVFFKARKYKEALAACEHALLLDVTYSRAYHGMGLTYTKMKDYGKALDAYEGASQLDSSNAKLAFDMGELLFILKDYRGGRVHYKRAIKLDRKYESFYRDRMSKLIINGKIVPYERPSGRIENVEYIENSSGLHTANCRCIHCWEP